MSDNSMKSCPFCGSHAVFRPDLDKSVILCSQQGKGCSVGPEVSRVTFSEAQRAWNFRFNERDS